MMDATLRNIVLEELARHLAHLEKEPDSQEIAGIMHSLKGALGLAGERELAERFARLERRAKNNELGILGLAAQLVKEVVAEIDGTKPGASWPVPPADLLPGSIDPALRTAYETELAERLERIDQALLRQDNPLDSLADLYRHVHTIKGGAGAVGDEPMAWFCHGLEERIKESLAEEDIAKKFLRQFSRHRTILAGLQQDSGKTLLVLRQSAIPLEARESTRVSKGPTPPPRQDGSIRVQTEAIDSLRERLIQFATVREALASNCEGSTFGAELAGRIRGEVSEALRMIGPPKPWGAPALAIRKLEQSTQALTLLGETLEQGAIEARAAQRVAEKTSADVTRELGHLRETPARVLFRRLENAATSEAQKMGLSIRFVLAGVDERLDRQLVERLYDPLLHLVLNAMAHGAEPEEVRQRLGKPRPFTLSLSVRRAGKRLSILVEDDGAGVDFVRLRERAVELGASQDVRARDDKQLLSLLFLPGFSTRIDADLLAGRGMGLDIVLSTIQRLGGTVHLESEPGKGFRSRIELPIGVHMAHVLWVKDADERYGLLCEQLRGVALLDEPVRSLSAWLGTTEPSRRGRVAFEVSGASPVWIAVDEILEMESAYLRPMPPIVGGALPYLGAVVRPSRPLDVVLDSEALTRRVFPQ